ncbi:spermidine synthase [Desulfospira joergensenii]|uniref:spermidine synthase n=1 Tax=Desulfospira joergensenii TaxID=53329 RepID=UPI0003B4DDF3|nr:spermidine synthase [Desulfospira joergensenii]
MGLNYEELDYRKTPLGDLMLRRRRSVQLQGSDIYEVKLGDHFLMSSLFHESEVQLSRLGLGMLEEQDLDVVVGGLGLGYTAVTALEDKRVTSLVVVEFMEGVIQWHQTGLVPLGKTIATDPRSRLVQGDFFALSRDLSKGFDPDHPGKKQDAILLDIDHTPTHVLHQTNKRFYTQKGLGEVAEHLKPGGIFALWSDSEPDPAFTRHLGKVFASAEARMVRFKNPLTGKSCGNTVYLARVA